MRPLSLPFRALYAGLAGVAALAIAAPAGADPNRDSAGGGSQTTSGPIGGTLLGSRGYAVQPNQGFALPPVVLASSYVLADLDTGEVLAAKNAHGRFAPASTLKTLTALTFIPRLSPNAPVKIPYVAGAVDGTKVGVVPGLNYPAHELFMSMLVMSANDSATAIASAQQPLNQGIRLMNREATRLHALDTVARNPTGLDAKGQVSSAYDLALIARAGMKLPDFAKYVSTKRSSISAPKKKRYEVYTHDHLLLNYKGAIGIKNGYTVSAQASFVGAAQRNGHRLVVALMRGEPLLWKDAAHLLDWGFAVDGRIEPAGQLVAPDLRPGEGPVSVALAPGTSTPAARHKNSAFTVPRAPLYAVAGIIVLFLLGRLRARRRRGYRVRSRSKFSLPPL
jgi:D-alanyl-D-alanine carboxypeptidase (penicillin-binding protein 5/6)